MRDCQRTYQEEGAQVQCRPFLGSNGHRVCALIAADERAGGSSGASRQHQMRCLPQRAHNLVSKYADKSITWQLERWPVCECVRL